MKIFTRYVFFKTLGWFLFTLGCSICVLTPFLILPLTFKGVPLTLALQVLPYLLPNILAITLPISSLFATTQFFSKMRANNEIIALKAMGIPPRRILYPVFALMIGVSFMSVWLNDLSTSWSRTQMKKTLLEGFESTILSQLRQEKRFSAPNDKYVVDVSAVDADGTLINPVFSCKKEELSVSAERAKIDVRYDLTEPVIALNLYNTEANAPSGMATLPREYPVELPIDEFFKSARIDPPAAKINDALDALDRERLQYHRELAAQACFSLLAGNVLETSKNQWAVRAARENTFKRKQDGLRLLVPRVWASGFSCFFFAWVGAPFAINYSKSEKIPAFFACFLPILLVYYPLFEFALEGAKNGAVPPIAIWLGNLVLGFWGVACLRKI